ncbi:MAG: hypothetical protein OEM26_00625 [Saprospiraceae bacterium]|nr:hypothetical protein [Saprospiraceae bacterium]
MKRKQKSYPSNERNSIAKHQTHGSQRRNFLKKSGLVIGASMLGNAVFANSKSTDTSSRKEGKIANFIDK